MRPQPLCVLIVDDCPDTTASLGFLLGLWGHRVLVAHDGPAALRLAAEQPPGVVLLDLGLPGMDGFEVARRLKELPGLDGMRLIAVTGFGQDKDRERSRLVGFDLHLVKPVDPDELQRLLDGVA